MVSQWFWSSNNCVIIVCSTIIEQSIVILYKPRLYLVPRRVIGAFYRISLHFTVLRSLLGAFSCRGWLTVNLMVELKNKIHLTIDNLRPVQSWGQIVRWSVRQSVDQLVCRSFGQSVSRSVSQSVKYAPQIPYLAYLGRIWERQIWSFCLSVFLSFCLSVFLSFCL